MNIDPQAASQILNLMLQPWQVALEDPNKAQELVLHRLLNDFALTKYGAQHGADQIETLEDYRKAFPITTL